MTERPMIVGRPWRRRMEARDPAERHRVASSLELFFDLCFVVAVGADAARLEHALAEGRVLWGVVGFLVIFAAINWSWLNYAWFASAYDTDDTYFRLATMVVMAGALVLSAGVPRAFDDRDLKVLAVGYAIMRLGLESQRLRAAGGDPAHRTTMLRFVAGEGGCAVYWLVVAFAAPEDWQPWLIPLGIVAELLVPPWAESAGRTTWHPHHIAERYGLLTIIVLGETVLSSTNAVRDALSGDASLRLYTVAAGGLITVFGMWWVYFSMPSAGLLTNLRKSIMWGYGHYVIYASGAAVGAGIAVNAAFVTHEAHISALTAGLSLTVPVFCYLLVVWWLLVRPHGPDAPYAWGMPVIGLLAIASSWTGHAVAVTGVLMALQIVLSIWAHGTKGSRPGAVRARDGGPRPR
ncbi:low temperature requirement protein A [Actinomadura logoneensis]|uniref:Low temperature requirement protein A n=1 Tax=Actinomadura logoneensis TaxID=2293572 RepID=A0A372J9E2_9ACTN|nr:low temperature requirement protein A [Actinomadura logoneensis]RFU36607.1 low temperature requirement protein A [Actinomadura logoneensis]